MLIYTDGGCHPNPGNGVWAFICTYPYTEYSGVMVNTTNNQMEMIAVLEAIKFAVEHSPGYIEIRSDSEYTVNGFNVWMDNWARACWRKKGGIKNIEIWQELYKLKQRHKIKLVWVRGHAGNEFNEACDQLVRNKYESVFGGTMKY